MKRRLDWLVLAVVAIVTVYLGLTVAWMGGVFSKDSAPTAAEQVATGTDQDVQSSGDASLASDGAEQQASAPSTPSPSPSQRPATSQRSPSPKPSESADYVRSFIDTARSGDMVNVNDYRNDRSGSHAFITADGNVLCEWIQERWVACTLGVGPDPHPEDVQEVPDGASGYYDPHQFSIDSGKVAFGTLTSEGLLYQPCLTGESSPDDGFCPNVAATKTLPDGKAIKFGDVICGAKGERIMCATTDRKYAIDVDRSDYTIYRR